MSTDVHGLQEDLFGSTGLQWPEPPAEEDRFLQEIVERFDGRVTGIGPVREWATETRIETMRPPAQRGRRRASEGVGRPEAVRLDEVIKLGQYSAYEKAKPKGSVQPWQLVWSISREPLGVGLFTTKEFAESRRGRV